jgi:hypothetical protein
MEIEVFEYACLTMLAEHAALRSKIWHLGPEKSGRGSLPASVSNT